MKYKMRAQQNTRCIEADVEEAVRTHTIDTLISMLTCTDIQSTITPDEGHNVPWHYNNIRMEEAQHEVRLGDEIGFYPSYGSLLAATTSPYMQKVVIRDRN